MNTQNEIWKAIPGYEGIYEVSTEGRVKRLERDGIMHRCDSQKKWFRHYKEMILKRTKRPVRVIFIID